MHRPGLTFDGGGREADSAPRAMPGGPGESAQQHLTLGCTLMWFKSQPCPFLSNKCLWTSSLSSLRKKIRKAFFNLRGVVKHPAGPFLVSYPPNFSAHPFLGSQCADFKGGREQNRPHPLLGAWHNPWSSEWRDWCCLAGSRRPSLAETGWYPGLRTWVELIRQPSSVRRDQGC